MTMLDLARPFLLLAAVAFLIGFAGYLTVANPATAQAAVQGLSPTAISGPASAEWNLPKHI